MNVRGRLITLEGIDGSGKTTVARALAPRLAQVMPEMRFVFTAEPTGGRAGRLLRESLARMAPDEASSARRLEELFLFLADHADHLAGTVGPALDRGATIISDRYTDSTAAYQGVTLRGVVPDPVEWIRGLYSPWNLLPDLTLLFAIDPSLALERIALRRKSKLPRGNRSMLQLHRSRHRRSRGPSRKSEPSSPGQDRFEDEEFLREVDGNFRHLARLEPGRFVLIDASRGMEVVCDEALSRILDLVSRAIV